MVVEGDGADVGGWRDGGMEAGKNVLVGFSSGDFADFPAAVGTIPQGTVFSTGKFRIGNGPLPAVPPQTGP